MDRETRRRFAAWRAEEATDPQNTVVDDLFAGECDRAGFIQRATMFGLSASGDVRCAARRRRGARRLREGDARQGRRPAAHRHDAHPEGHAGAVDLPGDGCAAAGRHLRRVPQPQPPEPHARARAGRQLEPERQRQRVDLQAPPGRQVRQRQAHDRRRRHRDVPPAAHGPDVAGRLGLQRRALGRRRQQGRRLHDHVQARYADRELPVPHQQHHLPGDHPPQGLRRPVREDAADHGRLQPGRVHARASAPATTATRTGGAARRRSTAST